MMKQKNCMKFEKNLSLFEAKEQYNANGDKINEMCDAIMVEKLGTNIYQFYHYLHNEKQNLSEDPNM